MLNTSLAKLLFWLGVLVIIAMSFAPTTTSSAVAAWDKAAHFFAFLFLSYLLWFAYRLPKPFLTSVILLGLFGLAIELLQHFVPNRIFSLYDFTADIAGIIAGASLYWLTANR